MPSADADSKPASSSLQFVYSCSTSEHGTVERPSLTTDSDDDDDDDDDDDESSGEDNEDVGATGTTDAARFGQHVKHSDMVPKKDVVRWRQRLVASPPPRRAAHTPRRFEDPDGTAATAAVQGRSVQSNSTVLRVPGAAYSGSPKSPESSKHVSFDPFTLSLNAALEGEMDVLQSFFSEVSLR